MAPNGLTEGRTDRKKDGRTDGRTDGHGQTYIPPPSAGDNKESSYSTRFKKNIVVHAKIMIYRFFNENAKYFDI